MMRMNTSGFILMQVLLRLLPFLVVLVDSQQHVNSSVDQDNDAVLVNESHYDGVAQTTQEQKRLYMPPSLLSESVFPTTIAPMVSECRLMSPQQLEESKHCRETLAIADQLEQHLRSMEVSTSLEQQSGASPTKTFEGDDVSAAEEVEHLVTQLHAQKTAHAEKRKEQVLAHKNKKKKVEKEVMTHERLMEMDALGAEARKNLKVYFYKLGEPFPDFNNHVHGDCKTCETFLVV